VRIRDKLKRIQSPDSGFASLRDGWRFLITRYLVVSSVPLLIAHAVTVILGLTRNSLLASFLTKDDYGALNYLLNWLPLVTILALPGFNLAIAQYVAKGHWEAIGLGLRRRLIFALLPMAALAALGWVAVRTGQDEAIPSLWFLTAFFFPTAQVLALVSSILGTLKRFRQLALFYVGQSAAYLLAAGIGLWLWPGQTIEGIILFQWLLTSLMYIWFWTQLRRSDGEPIPLSSAQRKQFYRFGMNMTVLNGIGQARTRLGALLLGSFVSFSTLADYAVGDLFFEQLKALWTIYYGVSYPRLITLAHHNRWKQVRRETILATPAFAALSGAVGAGLSFAVPWLFSAKYSSSLAYIWILLLAFVCSVPGGFFEMYFRVEESERALYWIRLTSATAGILLPPALLMLWGPLGVPTGRAGANLIYSVTGFTLYYRQAGRWCPRRGNDE
jgi:O-antigen/teichoic acid export membrane protein